MILNYLSSIQRRLRGTRRELFQVLAALTASRSVWGQQRTEQAGIYSSIGVRPLINARGTVTIVGATRTLPEVKRAMEEAARHYVQIDELMDAVGRRLSELTGAEWGVVTSGASAALTIATAACITGGDPDRMAQLPDLSGLKDEVIMPAYSRTAYDAAARSVGARILEIRDKAQLEAALGPRTAMIMVLAGGSSEKGPLSLTEIAPLAKSRGVPILVDAAAEELEVPNPHLAQGADLVAYSGGKCLRGPQCAGLLLGRKSLVHAAWIHSAPHHGIGRGMKVGREEIMGMLTAVEMWKKRNHQEEQRMWTSWLEHIAARLRPIAGVTTRIIQPVGRSNRTPSLRVSWDPNRIPLTGHEMEKLLWDGEPRIAVSGAGSFLPFPPNSSPDITVTPYQLEVGEERIIADRLFAVLSSPPRPQRNIAPPAEILTGEWLVEMRFAHGSANQRFWLEQNGANLTGTHHASFAARELTGSIHDREVLLRSSYTQRGVRLNFEFQGVVSGGVMQGRAAMGEYGMADWKAHRSR